MTAALLERPIANAEHPRCPKAWCLTASGCASEHGDDDLRLHYGRPSTVFGSFGGQLDVTPYEQDFTDGRSWTGPLVELEIDPNGRVAVGLTPDRALDFSAALAAFAAGEVAVGDEVTFDGYISADGPSGASVTIRRLTDEVFEYGNAAPRYGSFGAVKVILVDEEEPNSFEVGLSAPDAAMFARYVTAAAMEVDQ